MQINNRKLEITNLISSEEYSEADIINYAEKVLAKVQFDCENVETHSQEIISYFADEIVEAKTMQRMKNILIEFAHVFVAQVYTHANDKHTIEHVLDPSFGLQINTDFIMLKGMGWFNEAHKLVYGNKIPKFDQYILKEHKKFQSKNEIFLYKKVPQSAMI